MKKTRRINIIKNMTPYIKGNSFTVFLMIFTGILSAFTALISPRLFKMLVDDIIDDKRFELFAFFIAGLFFVYLIRFALDSVNLYFSNILLNNFTLNIRKHMLSNYMSMNYSDYIKHDISDLKIRLIEDVDKLGNFILEQISEYINNIFVVIVTAFLMFFIEYRLALICIAVIPLLFLIDRAIARGTKNINFKIRSVEKEHQDANYDSLQNWKTIKTQAAELPFIEKFVYYRKVLAKLGYKSILYFAYNEIFNDFKMNYLVRIFVYFTGIYFIVNSDLTLGSLYMFAEYYTLFFEAADGINRKSVSLVANEPYYNKVFEIINFIPEDQGTVPFDFKKHITFKNIEFSYPENAFSINDLSLEINKGEKIAIVGRNGSGKSTLFKLLTGIYAPSGGTVLFDDLPINKLDRRSFYGSAGIVMQDSFVFNYSIRENIGMNNTDTEKSIAGSCKKACIHDFIQSLPLKEETIIGENGIKLSGGQRQRISIASALFRDPGILFFDEATSNIDSETENRIFDSILDDKDKTFLFITHNENIIKKAEKVIFISNGRICGAGSHTELLNKNTEYKNIFEDKEALCTKTSIS